VKQLIEARLDSELMEQMDFKYPHICLDLMTQMVVETTTVLDTDFAPDEHFVYFKLPIGVDYE